MKDGGEEKGSGPQSPREQIFGGAVLGIITFGVLYFALGRNLSTSIGIGALWIIAFAVGAIRGD